MSPTIRRILFSTFTLLYLITTVVVLAYASGYRVSREHNSLVQTGIIFVNGLPRDATIVINKVARGDKLPYREIQVIPGSYQIRIEKDGYYPWEKNLTVLPRETAFATGVTLFRHAEPVRVSDKKNISSLAWENNTLRIVEARATSTVPTKTTSSTAADTTLAARGDIVWYTKKIKDDVIYARNIITDEEEPYALAPPDATLSAVASDPALLLWDTINGALYLAPKNIKTLIRELAIRSTVPPTAVWNEESRRWLITTDTEVWLLDTDGNTELLERASSRINHAAWIDDIPALLIHDGDAVKIVELDNRDRRNTYVLPIPPSARAVTVDPAGTRIAYSDDTGVWTLEIR